MRGRKGRCLVLAPLALVGCASEDAPVSPLPAPRGWVRTALARSGLQIEMSDPEPTPMPSKHQGVLAEYRGFKFRKARAFGTLTVYRYRTELQRKIEARAGKGALPEIYRSDPSAQRVLIKGREWFRSERTTRSEQGAFRTLAYFTRENPFSVLLTFTCASDETKIAQATIDRVLGSLRQASSTR